MRKLYRDFFHVSERGKIRDKVMLANVAMSVAVIVMCLASLSLSAYALFSCNVTSGRNTIRTASFKAQIQVQITDDNGTVLETVTPVTGDHQSFRIEGLKVGQTYTVTLKQIKDQTAAKTGFVIVSADNCPDTYHTQQLGADEKVSGGQTPEISFKLVITDSTNVYMKAHWGTSSFYDDYQNKGEELYITQGDQIKMIINGQEEPPKNNSQEKKDGTASGDKETTETTTPPVQTTPTEPKQTEPATTEPTEGTASTESEAAEETTEVATTEANS